MILDYLCQDTHDSSFGWVDGTAVDYENWNDYEPNNSGGMEGCVAVDGSTSKLSLPFIYSDMVHFEISAEFSDWNPGGWNDDHCAKLKGWACKKLKNATPPPPTTPMPTQSCMDGKKEMKHQEVI